MYNIKTARENQIKFLKSQMNCGFPNIERVAKQNYEKLMRAIAEEERMNAIVDKVSNK